MWNLEVMPWIPDVSMLEWNFGRSKYRDFINIHDILHELWGKKNYLVCQGNASSSPYILNGHFSWGGSEGSISKRGASYLRVKVTHLRSLVHMIHESRETINQSLLENWLIWNKGLIWWIWEDLVIYVHVNDKVGLDTLIELEIIFLKSWRNYLGNWQWGVKFEK